MYLPKDISTSTTVPTHLPTTFIMTPQRSQMSSKYFSEGTMHTSTKCVSQLCVILQTEPEADRNLLQLNSVKHCPLAPRLPSATIQSTGPELRPPRHLSQINQQLPALRHAVPRETTRARLSRMAAADPAASLLSCPVTSSRLKAQHKHKSMLSAFQRRQQFFG